MDKRNLLRSVLPYFTAIAVFAVVCIAYFAPQFEGRELIMHDIVAYEGSAKDIHDHKTEFGEDPQWTGNSFGGMPANLVSMEYPGQILKSAMPVFEFLGRPASLIFIAMAAFFVMLVLFGVRPWAAIPAALTYGLSTYFLIIIGAGHITKMVACAYAPLMVGGVFYTLRRNMWLGAALTALFASLQIAANHPQITYYFLFIIVALWVNELIRAVRKKLVARFAKATGLLAIAAVLAVGSNFAPLWYINQWSGDSIRGGTELTLAEGVADRKDGLNLEYATAWSYGIVETFNMYIPNLYGGSANFATDGQVADALTKYGQRQVADKLPSYWGDQPGTAGPTYVGAAAIFFATFALFMLPRRKTLWVSVVSLLAIALAWGYNFMWFTELFFYHFPGYDKFRTVAMILVIVQWSVPFLAALALAKLWKRDPNDHSAPALPKEKIMFAVKYTVFTLGGISLFFILLGGAIFDFASQYDHQYPNDILDAMRGERASMMRADAFRSLIFVILCAGIVFLYAHKKIKRGAMIALAAVVITIDLAAVGLRFLPHSRFEYRRGDVIQATAADRAILQDNELGFRVLNVSAGIQAAFNEANTSYFHRSLGGYHGAKMQRYQDIIDRYLMRGDPAVINMLNTKYIIQADQQGNVVPMLNPDAFGAAWFVDRIRIVDNADEEIAALATTDLRHEAIVDKRFAEKLTGAVRAVENETGVNSPDNETGTGSVAAPETASETADVVETVPHISLAEYRPNYLKYEYFSPDETYAVFSEIFYDKGWQAYIDGQPAAHFRADYILRAMVLPAGTHTVEFRFRAEGFDKISNITLVFSLLIIASLIAAIAAAALCNRSKRKNDERPKIKA